ncbi:uncharacterized protein LOC133286059 [Gastrolobium bilobum]|uniref:uncharacterized protein LOC133286059 n=1 Tax=Gastrolobium bilobum TaxID=150636 RepID=UPI002AB0940B|nr:uncharacterized protein LOC133286059 [Gastrolobium bilobum]
MASPQPHSTVARYNTHVGRSDQRHQEPRLARFHVSRSDQQHREQQIVKPTVFRFEVTFTLRYVSTDLRVRNVSTLFQTTECISCKHFFGSTIEDIHTAKRKIQCFLRRLLIPRPWSLQYFTRECLDEISQRIIPQVQQLFDSDPGIIKPPGSKYQEFPLSLEIVIDVPSDEGNQEMEHAVIEDSLQHFRMIPASKNAINSLEKFKVMKQNEYCTICMEKFDVSGDSDDVAASAMPCDHVFHQQCIVQWLQTSHVCPLCRYPMPIANEYWPN